MGTTRLPTQWGGEGRVLRLQSLWAWNHGVDGQRVSRVWVEVLYRMPKGKAMGVSGFSVELLITHERGGVVQRVPFVRL